MKKTVLFVFTALAFSLAALPSQAADMGTFSKAQKKQIEKMIENYILENPKTLVKAMENLQGTLKAEAIEATMAELGEMPVMGNPDGDVTIVEFFDYNCGYCKVMFKIIRDLVKEDGNIRWITVDLAMIAKQSIYAAKASLAAHLQGKYVDLHTKMMNHKGRLSKSAILDLAKETGLDIEQLEKDIDSEAIENRLKKNMELAQPSVLVQGVPTFIIGDTIMNGAVSSSELTAAIEEARK